ncbi:MAG: hypothetical protein J7L17_03435 [Thaumarchaeota archaeon]|nr:hypothetical protein [Nitrososphaerota archaeon]
MFESQRAALATAPTSLPIISATSSKLKGLSRSRSAFATSFSSQCRASSETIGDPSRTSAILEA